MIIKPEDIELYTKENVRSFVETYNKAVNDGSHFFIWNVDGRLHPTNLNWLIAAGFMTGEFNDDKTFTIKTQI